MASPVCSTPRLLKEVAPPLDKPVLCSQATVKRQLQDPAHRAPKDTDACIHFDRLKSCHLPAMAEEGYQVFSNPLDEDAILSTTLLYQQPPWISFKMSLRTPLVVLLNDIIPPQLLESLVPTMLRMQCLTPHGATQSALVRVLTAMAIL